MRRFPQWRKSEGKGNDGVGCCRLAESTLIDSVTRYDYMREYLAQMLLALDTTEKRIGETASVEMRLAADVETVAAELLGEIKEENTRPIARSWRKNWQSGWKRLSKSISVENVMTGEKDVSEF